MSVRDQAEGFHHTCFLEARDTARRNIVDIKMPRVCKRQTNRANALVSDGGLSEEEKVESYYRVNVTIPLLDEIVGSVKNRFDAGQEVVLKGTRLLPAYMCMLCPNQTGSVLYSLLLSSILTNCL